MFDQTFVATRDQRTRQPYTVLASALLQAAVLGGCVLASILYTQTLPNAASKSMLVAPPPPPSVPKGPELKLRHTTPAVRAFHPSAITAPRAIPTQIPRINDLAAAPDIGPAEPNDAANLAGNSLLWASNGPAVAIAPEPPAPPKPVRPRGPMRIGGTVAEANLIHRVQPVYPPLAKAARIRGDVEFTALISQDGRIENLKLVSGHPLLVNAARDAILQWRYRPTLLNGEPVEVTTDILVHFSLAM